MNDLLTKLNITTTAEQYSAMSELDKRGLSFCSHFGTDNAVAILASMNEAMADGMLYEWMQNRLGIAV